MSDRYSKYADLADYVFGEVRQNFEKRKNLTTVDFFSIIIWKANRAKSKIARRILENPNISKAKNLDSRVKAISENIYSASGPKERLKYLITNCSFRLPMASAILSVLYPDEFTIYDVRVCEELGRYKNLKNKTNFERLWEGYLAYKADVIKKAPNGYTFRQADQYLWGKSFYQQLKKDISNNFVKPDQKKSK